ncbi:uncharacterized protein PRCAT00005837001 [Priceomyces carsonii]|uniref:uncharacterized protein n=1 Tax=Priceomyces carsonii TaxID=28549 RepID=UPI002ED92B1E|nr:unnamed protein product [Priceomyces carsonii]
MSVSKELVQKVLQNKALTYKSSNAPLSITEQRIDLITDSNDETHIPANSILIKVSAVGLNMIDLIFHRLASPLIFSKKPKTIGIEYSGAIVAIGSGVETDFKVGDEICGINMHPFGNGTSSQYILIDSTSKDEMKFCSIPENLSLREACYWPVTYSTASELLESHIKLSKNSRVLIVGGSTMVGRFCIQLLKAIYGVKEIVAVCSDASSKEVLELGADKTIDYKKYLSIAVPATEAAGPEKFDMVLDCVGTFDLFSSIDNILKPKAESSVYVSIAVNIQNRSPFTAFLRNALGMVYLKIKDMLNLSTYNYVFQQSSFTKDTLEEGKKLIESNTFELPPLRFYDWKDYKDAFKKLEGRSTRGKLILCID